MIVCYTGGTCGHVLSAIIDSQGCEFNGTAVKMSPDRCLLNKPHTFLNALEKTKYVHDMSLVYNSLPSHDLDYHVGAGQDFITVTVNKVDTALWAAERFKQLHRPNVWEEMQKFCGANDVNGYAKTLIDYSNMVKTHTTKIIALERILSGHAVEDLANYVDSPELDNNFYQEWLKLQNYAG
jgi:hypothetical protein